MSTTYSEKLKDPRWQKKRLEIFNRDEWTCNICGDTKDTLMVHHKSYINGNEPWDYNNKYLITLCRTCHQVVENSKNRHRDFDIKKLRACFITNDEDALVIYKYDSHRLVAIMKRGIGVAIEEPDIKKITALLKVKSNG